MNESSGSTSAPLCVGIIMDGNRRWARERGLPSFEGHRVGSEVLRTIVKSLHGKNVAHLILYTFSTENWDREPKEVAYLMDLFREFLGKHMEELKKENLRIRFVGQLARFPDDIQARMREVEHDTSEKDGGTLWLGMSYGGRAEIVAAARSGAEAGEEITEESLARHMWTAGMPDPDLIIRTSGEQRLSGFLTWQGVYSELFFTKTKWPDFSPEEFDAILAEYAQRERRRGK